MSGRRSAAAAALAFAICISPAPSAALWDDDSALLGRVAAYYRCRRELEGARGEEKAVLGRRLGRMRERLEHDRIDYASFEGVRGACEDIFGDWFLDGTWMSNSVYRPFLQKFDLVRWMRRLAGRPRKAVDVLPGGGVPDSAFFVNRDIESVAPADLFEEERAVRPEGAITVTGEKKEGKSEGFYGKDERGRAYIIIVDPPGMEEQVTGAEMVGSTLMRLAGYNVPRSAIITIRGTGLAEFDGRRGVATRLIEGYRGHWSYGAFRGRREIRATRVFSAWMHNSDCVDHNTGISVVDVDGVPLTRYYIFDFGGALGSWNIRTKEPRDGWENYVDFGQIVARPLTWPLSLVGLYRKPYGREGIPYSEAVGYFDSNVRPDRYKANYPNMAWRDMTPEDGLWAARLIARFSEAQIRAAVDLARYSRKEDADYIYRTLLARRKKILDHYELAPTGR